MSQDYSFTRSKVCHKDLDAHIGQKIKFRRSILGMSQDKLGAQLGITFQQIQKYEKGVNRVSASMLYDIARILNVDIEYFVEEFSTSKTLHDDNTPRYNTEYSKEKESKETSDLLKAYYKTKDPIIRKKILEIVKAFAIVNNPKKT